MSVLQNRGWQVTIGLWTKVLQQALDSITHISGHVVITVLWHFNVQGLACYTHNASVQLAQNCVLRKPYEGGNIPIYMYQNASITDESPRLYTHTVLIGVSTYLAQEWQARKLECVPPLQKEKMFQSTQHLWDHGHQASPAHVRDPTTLL